jgi:hypothetical protein
MPWTSSFSLLGVDVVTFKWQPHRGRSVAMNGENRQLFTDGLVEDQEDYPSL